MIINYKNKNIFAFSDTHDKHRGMEIPQDTDILICAGDVCEAGDEMQLQDFYNWFAGQSAKHKLFVPGNHDLPFEIAAEYAVSCVPEAITYIEQGGIVWEGIHLFVLPVRMGLHFETSPCFIPSNIDILITHCPPKDILDDNGRWGCPILRELIDHAEPKIHLFGHCHQTAGEKVKVGRTEFWNVGVVNKENFE